MEIPDLANRIVEESAEKIEYAKHYAENKLNLVRATMVEKMATLQAKVANLVLILVLAMSMMLFLSIAAGFAIGDVLDSRAYGFLVVVGAYFLLFVLFLMTRGSLLKNLFIADWAEALLNDDE